MKKIYLAVGLLCLGFLGALSPQKAMCGEETLYDLPSSIGAALKGNPSLAQSRHNVMYYENGVALAKKQFGPQLFLHGSIVTFDSERDFSPLISTPGTTLITREASGTNYVAGLTLTQPVFREGSFFGKRSASVERERNSFESERFTEQALEADVVYRVSEAYGNILKTLNAAGTEEEGLKTSELLYKTARSKYSLEMINKVELLDAEKAVVDHKIKIETLGNDLAANMGALAASIGSEGLVISRISTDMAQFRAVLCAEESLPPFEQLVQAAYRNRNDLKAQESLVESIANNLNVVKSKRYPEVSLNAGYFQTGDAEFEESGKAWNLLARADILIFDFGRTKAEVSREQNRLFAQQEALRALKNDIRSEARENYQKMENLKAELAGLAKSEEQAREALLLAREKYNRELISELDLMKAQDKLSEIELSIHDAEIDLVLARLALKKSAGLKLLECR